MNIVSALHKSLAPLWFVLLLLGAGFADADAFIDGDVKAKWYAVLVWLGVTGLFSPLWKRNNKMSLEKVAWMVMIVAFLQAAYGIGQFVGLFARHTAFQTSGNFDNPAGYASMLACSVSFVLWLAFSRYGWQKWTAWGVYGLVMVSLVLSGSRAGLLATIFVTVQFVARRWRSMLSNASVWFKGLGVLLTIVSLCGLYAVKKDSADGRLLIWRCTLDMIQDAPWFGHGHDSFEAKYMLYQACYFARNPDSRFALLADNVKHPFNEFLLLAAEGGLVALGIILGTLVGLLWLYTQNKSKRAFVGMTLLCSVFILSLFTYPLKYPFTWLTVLCGTVLVCGSIKLPYNRKVIYSTSMGVLSFLLLVGVIRDMYYENRWCRVVDSFMLGKTKVLLPEYERIASYLKRNAYFLYNYAAELNYLELYEESQVILLQCEKKLNDYDVQMLAGDNCLQSDMSELAEKHFQLASNMCPNRFIPLYRLAQLYEATGDSVRFEKQARIILHKKMKIPSMQVMDMKRDMEQRLLNITSY